MNKFAFIIGAHKTGTTFLNKYLAINSATLLDKGVYFERSQTVRPNISRYLAGFGDSTSRRTVRKYIFSHESEYNRIIFSNENISGTIPSFFKNRSIYPNLFSRLTELNKITEGRDVDLILFIRSYDDFIASCYSEFVRSRGFDLSFREFQDAVLSRQPNWIDIVDTIKTAYPAAEVKIFQQSDIRHYLTKTCSAIVGAECSGFKTPSEFEGRQSLSSAGVDVMALMEHFGYRNQPPEFVNRLAMILPSSQQFGGPFRMSDADAKFYQASYVEHLGELKQMGLLLS